MLSVFRKHRSIKSSYKLCIAYISSDKTDQTFTVKKLSEIKKKSSPTSLSSEKQRKSLAELPEVPTTCCQSGCPNCVWLDYAEELTKYYKDGGKGAMAAIQRDIEDPNLREYLLFEMRMKNLS